MGWQKFSKKADEIAGNVGEKIRSIGSSGKFDGMETYGKAEQPINNLVKQNPIQQRPSFSEKIKTKLHEYKENAPIRRQERLERVREQTDMARARNELKREQMKSRRMSPQRDMGMGMMGGGMGGFGSSRGISVSSKPQKIPDFLNPDAGLNASVFGFNQTYGASPKYQQKHRTRKHKSKSKKFVIVNGKKYFRR